jgi:drug/metabolite transporter (DMT)-like permease
VTSASSLGGVALAAAAAVCFDGALAFQAAEARREDTMRAGHLLARLARRPRWLLATGLAALGWPLQLAALSLAPVTVVQPTLAFGLIVLLAASVVVLGEGVGPIEIAGALAILAGVVVLTLAAPDHADSHSGLGVLLAVVAPLAVVALAPWLRHGRGHAAALGAGAGFVATGLTTKLVSDGLATGDVLAIAGWGALTALLAVSAAADDMAAMQDLPASRVAPAILAAEIVGPVLLAPFLFGEKWGQTPGGGVWIVVGLIAVLCGTLPLAASTTSAAAGSEA